MAKVNFSKIIINDIEGREVPADFQKQLGNQLYMQGHDIEECKLGWNIYHAEGDMELTEKEIGIVSRYVAGYSYLARTAIEKAMKGGEA